MTSESPNLPFIGEVDQFILVKNPYPNKFSFYATLYRTIHRPPRKCLLMNWMVKLGEPAEVRMPDGSFGRVGKKN